MVGTPTSLARQAFAGVDLGDERLNRRAGAVAERLMARGSASFPKRFSDPAALKGFYRLMTHAQATHATLLRPHVAQTHARMATAAGVVLCLHDTTVLDYSGLTAIPDLGQVGNGNGRGLYAHNCPAVAADTRAVLGLAGQLLHRRRRAPNGEPRTTRRTNPDRESRLWKALSRAIPAAAPGKLYVDIADRGADILEFLDAEAQAGKSFVVRSRHNRGITWDHAGEPTKAKLHDLARTLPERGRHDLEVRAKDGRPGRTAAVCVAWQRVAIQPPRQPRGDERGVPLAVDVIRVWEPNPPPGTDGLEWILLTNVAVGTVADAGERIRWYGSRWIIEELHKAMKTGCGIENMQFRSRARLEPAIAMLSVVATLLLTLRDQSRAADATNRLATDAVPVPWVRVLSRWREKRARLDWSVHDFFAALARLGGHQNRKHDHRPGWLVLWRGWTHLQCMLEGAAAASEEKCG